MKTSLLSVVAVVTTLHLVSGCGPAEPGATPSESELGQATAALSDGQVVTLQAAHSLKCLDVDGISTDNGARLQQWDCWGGGNQAFRLKWNSTYRAWNLVAVHSGKCLDVRDYGTTNGTPLQQWDCGTATNQLFTFEYVIGDEYRIHPVGTGRCVDISGYSLDNGAQAQLWDCNIGSNQLFHMSW